ncbi:FtsX-like permease family protein [[Eubacterium] cellulosolvens]
MSTRIKKSWKDLKKRKSRTTLMIIVIALGVIGLSLFGVIPLIEQGIAEEIETSNMYDIRANVNNLELAETNFTQLEEIDNVKSVEGKYQFFTRIYIGERRNDALIVGIKDFNEQTVDIITKDTGDVPGYLEVLTDTGNSRNKLYNGEEGDELKVYCSNGSVRELKLSGSGHSLSYDHSAWGIAVFYTNLETVHSLSNGSGYTLLSFDLEKANQEEAQKTVEDVRAYLLENTDFVAFTDLPRIREEGDWPGKEEFANMGNFFFILTYVTLFCSFFLVANTMHTMIMEQKKEVAQMKAVGATRWQVLQSYLLTSLIMGVIGALIGTIIGIFIAFLMASFLANTFFGVILSLAVHPPTLLLGFLVGVGITLLATLPSLIFALRITVREGMEGSGISSNYGNSYMDRFLLRIGWLPRSAQMGLRNVSRKKGRSASTILLVSIAVGILLGVLSLGVSMGATIEKEFDNFTYDIMVTGQPEGGKPLTEDVKYFLEDLDGVSEADPFLYTQVQFKENQILTFGYNYNTISYNIEDTICKGRWFDAGEQESNATVVIVSKIIATDEGINLGDKIQMQTATGPYEFEVIGFHSSQMNHGMAAFMPISTVQDILKWNNNVTGFSIKTSSSDHDVIDSVSTHIEDELLSNGYMVNIEVKYVMEEINKQFIGMVTNLLIAVGSLVVIITMIGLMSALTMNILERTKEIGMMRCLGSISGHIRWVFGVEGLIMALIGWVIGIPLGYFLGGYLAGSLYDLIRIEVVFIFPIYYVFITFLITLGITILIIQPSLWKATHLKPGDALRYQ